MDGEEAPASSPFAPRSSLARTPPSGLGPPLRMQIEEDMALTPPVPARQPRPQSTPPSTSVTAPVTGPTAAPSVGQKRPLTSPEERRPVDVVRMCRPVNARPPVPAPSAAPRAQPPPVAGILTRNPQTGSRPVTPEVGPSEQDGEDSLFGASKADLMDRVHRDLEVVMATVTAHTSRLNKDATNIISTGCRSILAVVAALTLRLSEKEIELSEEKLRAANLERDVLRAKAASQMGAPHSAPSSGATATINYASVLRTSKKAEPVPIPAARGPVLAFYPAPEHAAAFKSAEDTKAELKKNINPQEIQVQVERLRKVGNAGVVLQTTSEASAEKLRKATPATLRVTEPKRRSPLVSLRHIDGDGEIEDIYQALQEHNFKDSEWTMERLRSQSKLAFKKRGRGTTTVVLECSPQLREALLTKGKVYINWQVIEVVDFLSVTCCRKYQQYGHPEKYCRSTEVYCGRCGASGHRREDCSAATECCATCKRFNRSDAANHVTADAACPVRQHAEARSVSNTDYGR